MEAMFAALDAGRASASAETDATSDTGASAETKQDGVDPIVLQTERADALVSVAQAYLQHSPRTHGTGYEMLACDCSRVDVEVSESGEILDVGRARRTIPSAIGRALRTSADLGFERDGTPRWDGTASTSTMF